MYSISDLIEIGSAAELIMGTKVQDVMEDIAVPSEFPSERFDE